MWQVLCSLPRFPLELGFVPFLSAFEAPKLISTAKCVKAQSPP